MTIDVHFNNASVAELHIEMAALLRGQLGSTAISTGTVDTGAQAGGATSESRLTPAQQKKAAEKAAKEHAAAQAAAAGTGQSISSGEDRTDPAADAQDAKDEAAAEKPAEPIKLTHDSVRAVLGGYVQAFGMAAAQEDGSKLMGIAKISEIPSDQAALAKAVIAIATGIEKNPHKRDVSGDGITAEKLAELKPIVAAAMAVK